MTKVCEQNRIEKICIPKMEHGCEKMNWSLTESMLEKYLVNEGIDVQVFTNRQALAVNSVGEIVDEKSPLEVKLKKMQREDEY